MTRYFRLKNVNTGEVHTLKSPNMILGRNAFSDIHIDSGLLSRQHAEIRVAADRVTLEDLNSTNGTYVNNMRIDRSTELMHGDVVTVGHEKLMLIGPDKHDGSTVFTYNLSQEPTMDAELGEALGRTRMQQSFPAPLAWSSIGGGQEDMNTNRQVVRQALSRRQIDADLTAALFVVRSGAQQGAVYDFPVRAENEWKIGRNKFVDVVVDHPTVSNTHARLRFDGEQWVIEDNQSTNGIKINRKRVVKAVCQNGDVISLGNLEVIFAEV